MRAFVIVMGVLLAAVPARADVLSKVVETEQIRLGVRADAPPFSYLDPDRGYRGLAVEICREVVARIGLAMEQNVKPVFVEESAKTRFEALVEGRTDLHCGPATATLSRREIVDFSILYFVDGVSLAGMPGAYDEMFETREAAIGVLEGTTAVGVVKNLVDRNELAAKIVSFPSHEAGLAGLEQGKVDLYAGDQAILLFLLSETFPDADFVVQDEVLSFEPYALVMRRGESALRLAVDRALSQIMTDGMIFELVRRSFGDYPLPPEAEAAYEIVGLPE